LSQIAAGVLVTVAAASLWRGARLLRKGLTEPDHPDQTLRVIKGMRGGIVAVALAVLAGWALTGERWLLIFALIFLGEELLETGIMLFALRMERRSATSANGKDRAARPTGEPSGGERRP